MKIFRHCAFFALQNSSVIVKDLENFFNKIFSVSWTLCLQTLS